LAWAVYVLFFYNNIFLSMERKIVYNRNMAKRATGVGKGKKRSPHKTKKRLEAKRRMLLEKAAKRKRHPKKKRKK